MTETSSGLLPGSGLVVGCDGREIGVRVADDDGADATSDDGAVFQKH